MALSCGWSQPGSWGKRPSPTPYVFTHPACVLLGVPRRVAAVALLHLLGWPWQVCCLVAVLQRRQWLPLQVDCLFAGSQLLHEVSYVPPTAPSLAAIHPNPLLST